MSDQHEINTQILESLRLIQTQLQRMSAQISLVSDPDDPRTQRAVSALVDKARRRLVPAKPAPLETAYHCNTCGNQMVPDR